MLVVSDTTPIISLLKVGKLDLLRELFGEVVIPEAVFSELTSNDRFAEEAREVERCAYIVKATVENRESVSILQRVGGLHLGESEALVLADLMKASLILIDELPGRNAAHSMDLNYMGTVGLLSTAYRKQMMTDADVATCVRVLKDSGRHISDDLYSKITNQAGSIGLQQ